MPERDRHTTTTGDDRRNRPRSRSEDGEERDPGEALKSGRSITFCIEQLNPKIKKKKARKEQKGKTRTRIRTAETK